jgi:anti-sigma regulatory factor (Ser/Thr protein kinase)
MLRSEILLRNQEGELARLAEWVSDLGSRHALSAELVFRLDLILAEAVSNVIFYAYPQGGEHWISIQVQQEDQRLVVQIQDDGIPFNPLERPEPAKPPSLEHAPIGGLGIVLIRRFSSHLAYQNAAGKNILTITIDDNPG